MEVLIRDLYCYECSLQFNNKYVFDMHLSIVHGEKLGINEDEENSLENKSKRRKVSLNLEVSQECKGKFKCGICQDYFAQRSY